MLGAVCDAILGHVGTTHVLAVAKLANYEELAARSNLPTTLLLAQRFFVATGASRADWISIGSLSASHVALILPPGAGARLWKLQAALDEFSVHDPSVVDRPLLMQGISVVVALDGVESLRGLFAVVDAELIAAEGGMPRSPNRAETWCSAEPR